MIANYNIHSIKKIIISLFILFCCCLIAWWPLTFHIFSLKNDALNYHLAIRYQISESISSGYLPLWSPYLNLGYPLHGDMQSGTWNPIVQIISLFGPYTLKTLQSEFLLYIYLSGVGMFFLLKYFFKDLRICLLAASAYMLCGYISDSAQFLNWISAATFLPFVFLFYYRTIIERNWKTALICGIFYFLLFTAAYPADFILISYLLLILFLWHLFLKQNRAKKIILQQVKLNLLIGFSFLLLSLPAIISYAEFLPLTERGSGATYEQSMNNYLHPGLLLSFLTPLAAWKASFAAVTDPLTRNCFLGLITFVLLITAFFCKSDQRLPRFLKWAFVLSLFFSFGPLGGLRVISYYLLPLMNTFRHPANARLFCIFFGCLLAAFCLRQLITGNYKNIIRKQVWIILLICFTGLLAWSFTGPITIFTNHNVQKNVTGFKSILDSFSFYDMLLLNIILQIPFLLLIYFWFVKKLNIKGLVIAGLINSVLHTMLYQPFSSIKKDRVSTIQNVLNSIEQKGYPIPDLNTSIAKNSIDADKYFDQIGSYNMYSKKIGRTDYKFTPSNLLTQNEFWNNNKIRNIILEYPFFYRADTIVKIKDSSKLVSSQKKMGIIGDGDQIKRSQNSDSTSIYITSVKKFTPNGWQIEVQNYKPGFFCIFQNYYPRWLVYVDGKKQLIERCNISFMGLQLPSGNHLIAFQYKAWDLKLALLTSWLTLGFILFLLFPKKTK